LRSRFIAIWMAAGAGLLVTVYVAVLEWRQASLCHEIRSIRVSAEDHLQLGVPWAVIVACLLVTVRQRHFRWAAYPVMVLSLLVALMEFDQLAVDWVLGMGLWMPHSLFCDQNNWVDFELAEGLLTGLIVMPVAGVLLAATAADLLISWLRWASAR
jgi:hypothetical protein